MTESKFQKFLVWVGAIGMVGASIGMSLYYIFT